jgi:hypothetical protein
VQAWILVASPAACWMHWTMSCADLPFGPVKVPPLDPVVGVVVGGLVEVPLPMTPVPSGEVTLDPSGSAL